LILNLPFGQGGQILPEFSQGIGKRHKEYLSDGYVLSLICHIPRRPVRPHPTLRPQLPPKHCGLDHQFADQRTLCAIPNFWNVVSNIPFAIVGILA
jgi:hypothetical protein